MSQVAEKRKVLITASSFAHIMNFHLPYISAFHQLGWETYVVCGGTPMEIPCADHSILIPLKKKMLAFDNLRAARAIRRLVRENGFDLMITHTSLAAFFSRLALLCLSKRPKCINVVHGYLFDDQSGWGRRKVYSMAERLVAGVTDQILTMNQYDLKWGRKHFPKIPVCPIPGMGADETHLLTQEQAKLDVPEGSFVLFFAGEFSERKNQSMLIRAMKQLPEQVRLVLPGDGALLEQCRQLAKQLGVSHRVLFPGHVKQVIPLLRCADVAVSASRYEGLPFNLIEALQCGLPIVASRVKGNADLVEEQVNGFLYSYDDADGFASVIRKLLEEETLCKSMGRASLERAPQYGLKTVQPQVMKAYLLGDKERGENS